MWKNYRWDRNLWCEVANCNVRKANIGILEHVQCTCISDSPKMSVPKFKYKLQTCKIKSSKLSSLNSRIFTNFKTLGHEFSIYGHHSRSTGSSKFHRQRSSFSRTRRQFGTVVYSPACTRKKHHTKQNISILHQRTTICRYHASTYRYSNRPIPSVSLPV